MLEHFHAELSCAQLVYRDQLQCRSCRQHQLHHLHQPCTTSRTQDCVISSKEKVSCTVSQSSTRKMSYASSPRLPPESIDAPPACLSLSARPAAIVATPTPDRDICWILAGRTESNVHKVKKIINVAEGPNSTIEHLVNFEVFHRLLVGRGVCLASLPLPEPEILHLPCVVESFCIYKGRCAHAHTYTHARHACAHTHTHSTAGTHPHTHTTHTHDTHVHTHTHQPCPSASSTFAVEKIVAQASCLARIAAPPQ